MARMYQDGRSDERALSNWVDKKHAQVADAEEFLNQPREVVTPRGTDSYPPERPTHSLDFLTRAEVTAIVKGLEDRFNDQLRRMSLAFNGHEDRLNDLAKPGSWLDQKLDQHRRTEDRLDARMEDYRQLQLVANARITKLGALTNHHTEVLTRHRQKLDSDYQVQLAQAETLANLGERLTALEAQPRMTLDVDGELSRRVAELENGWAEHQRHIESAKTALAALETWARGGPCLAKRD